MCRCRLSLHALLLDKVAGRNAAAFARAIAASPPGVVEPGGVIARLSELRHADLPEIAELLADSWRAAAPPGSL